MTKGLSGSYLQSTPGTNPLVYGGSSPGQDEKKGIYTVAVCCNGTGSHHALCVSDSASGLALVSGLSERFISVLAWLWSGLPVTPGGSPLHRLVRNRVGEALYHPSSLGHLATMQVTRQIQTPNVTMFVTCRDHSRVRTCTARRMVFCS